MFEKWLKPKDAPKPELEEQLARAEQAHRAALAGVEDAQATFDDRGDDAAATALARAREAEQLACDHVARAKRLVEAARAREAEEKREKLLLRERELEQQLTHEALKALRAPSLDAEVQAFLDGADARAARHEVERKISLELKHELLRVRTALGHEPSPASHHGGPPSGHAVAAALANEMGKLSGDDPRRQFLGDMIRALAPNMALHQFQPPDEDVPLTRRAKQAATALLGGRGGAA